MTSSQWVGFIRRLNTTDFYSPQRYSLPNGDIVMGHEINDVAIGEGLAASGFSPVEMNGALILWTGWRGGGFYGYEFYFARIGYFYYNYTSQGGGD
jgi:hypothetical protein